MGSSPSTHSSVRVRDRHNSTPQPSVSAVQNANNPNIQQPPAETKVKQTKLSPVGPGEIDVGDYRIKLYPIIGSGAFGHVCQANNRVNGETIAAKAITVADRGRRYDGLKAMAIAEGDKMKSIAHPNIVKLFDYSEHENTIWLFTEFCELGDLDHYLGKNPTLSFRQRLQIKHEMTLAVSYIHRHDLVHRDIKPENTLMKNNKPVAKLTDFGYAKIYEYSLSQPTFSTIQNRSSAGTPRYCAPECFLKKGDLNYTSSVDVFSLGLMFAVIHDSTIQNRSSAGTPRYCAPEFFPKKGDLNYTSSVDVFSLGLMFAVIHDYGPDNLTIPDQATFPLSVESRKASKTEIFGREMANAYREGQPLPHIVEITQNDNDLERKLKQLISQMTAFESKQRCKKEQVKTIIDSITGEFIKALAGVWYWDVAVHGGGLYASSNESPVIDVYDCHTWSKLRTIHTPCWDSGQCDNSNYLCVNDFHINLCCFDLNIIYTLDTQGTHKASHGPDIRITQPPSHAGESEHITGASRLDRPRICQEDDAGALLVTEESNRRLLVLSEAGQWREVRLKQELSYPRSAVWWREQLYVSTLGDDHLTIFE